MRRLNLLQQAGRQLVRVAVSWTAVGGIIGGLPVVSWAGTCSTLGRQIEAVVDQPAFQRSRWGILVQTLSPAPTTLYDRDAAHFFIPASNVKLLTSAAVLTRLGADFRIQTPIYALNDPATGPVRLHLLGQGDPSLDQAQLAALAQQLFDRGIRQIDQLTLDDRYLRGDAVNPNWEWEDVQAGYGAPVNSLIVAQNWIGLTLIPQALHQPLRVQWDDPSEASRWRVINRSQTVDPQSPEFVAMGRDLTQPILMVQGQLRVGSSPELAAIAEPQPAQRFLEQFRQALADRQIAVGTAQVIASDDSGDPADLDLVGSPIAQVESKPLSELLQEVNQQSNNLYAEALLRIMGNHADPTTDHSLESGIATLQQTLSPLQVDPEGYQLVDGSGLARQNLASPQAFVQTLQAMARTPNAAVYRNSLSTAGVNGSLVHRWRNSIVAHRLQGKSGFLTGAIALSGYLQRDQASELVFSILVNHTTQSSQSVLDAIDRIVLILAEADCE